MDREARSVAAGSKASASSVGILSLPAELLMQVFELYIEGCWKSHTDFGNCPTPFEPYAGPWLLTKICRQWRNIALSRPLLWTDIRFHFSAETESSGVIQLLTLQLDRSGADCPLSISVDAEQLPSSSESRCVTLANLLFAHRRRWKRLELLDMFGVFYHALRASASNQPIECPILERLLMHIELSDNYSILPRLFDEHSCPALRTAAFHTSFPPTSGLPWGQLEEVEVLHIEYIEYFISRYNEALTNLTTLKFVYCGWTDAMARNHTFLNLKNIIAESSMCVIYAGLVTPALEAIDCRRAFDDSDVYALTYLIRNSGCSIRSFSCVVDSNLETEEFLGLLIAMNALQELSLKILPPFDVGWHEIILALQRKGDSDAFEYCPRLHHLRIEWIDPKDPRQEEEILVLLEMLELRQSQASTADEPMIEAVELVCSCSFDEVSESAAQRLSALQDGRVKILFGTK